MYGRFGVRLVVGGYTQIPVVDFTENYSPVVTDVTLRVILIMWLINKWDSHTIYTKIAFLYTVLEGEIYIKYQKECQKYPKNTARTNIY